MAIRIGHQHLGRSNVAVALVLPSLLVIGRYLISIQSTTPQVDGLL